MSYPDTPEQAAIIAWKGKRLVVSACAGSGKTTTLRRFAEENQTGRMLYVAYTYLKIYQLSKLDLSSRYITVLFDEAQDANPVTSSIILEQACRVVLAADTHQQIYRFRGADNALQAPLLECADRLWLTITGKGGSDRILTMVPRTFVHHAILHRSVCGVIRTALHRSLVRKKVFWVGGWKVTK